MGRHTLSCHVNMIKSALHIKKNVMVHGSCFHHRELDICFDEFNYHDSLQASGIEES